MESTKKVLSDTVNQQDTKLQKSKTLTKPSTSQLKTKEEVKSAIPAARRVSTKDVSKKT